MNAQRILITAGSTMSMIDQVRGVTNIFRGRTGAHIAEHFAAQGDQVTLVTSDASWAAKKDDVRVLRYRTFEDLRERMYSELTQGSYDVLIHSAAVSDYRVDGVYGTAPGAPLATNAPELGRSGKIKSNVHEALWMRLVRTEKLVDLVRTPWGFTGVLVKFKLQVGITDEELIAIACASRIASRADIIVANALETASQYAYILDATKRTQMTSRAHLPAALRTAIHAIQKGAWA